MKIVCDSCSAKYSIADEKVAGKVFKIRCKKCSNVIVVRGDSVEGGSDDDESTRVFDYGGDAAWHLVLDGEQQGPFTPLQIAGMLSDGTIDYESYVWKEGFDGWKALNEVPELMAALGSGGEQAGADDGGSAGADPFAAASSGGGGLFASESSGGGANDLFASSGGGNLFGGGGGDDVVASKPAPRVSAGEAMTGQRNENSVLFSLSNLQALATGGEAPKPAAKSGGSSPLGGGLGGGGLGGGAGFPASSGMAMGEGSGLIDIRALASATAAAPAASPMKKAGSPVDDLLSIGVGPSLGSALGAPILAPVAPEPVAVQAPAQQSGGSNKLLLVAAVVAIIAALGAVAFALTRPPEIREVVTQAPAAPSPTGTTADPAGTAPATGDTTGAAPTGTTPTEAAPTAETPTTGHDSSGSSGSRRPGSSSSSSSSMSATASTEMAASSSSTGSAATPIPAPATMQSSSMASIDDLLGMAVAPMDEPSADLPDTPSRASVSSALGGRAAAVRACGNGATGTATVAVTFSSNGRVTSANVTGGAFAGNSCIANAVRGARVPAFRQASFNVNFPYRL